MNHFFKPDIDLFATRLNFKLSRYVSWNHDPGSEAVDAFTVSWAGFSPYLFPPFCLILRVLQKVQHDCVDKAIIVVPNWSTQPWFPILLDLIVETPARLPKWKDLVFLPHDHSLHPLFRSLNLIVCVVSGKRWKRRAYQQTLVRRSYSHGDLAPTRLTTWDGNSGEIGVINGGLISTKRLKKT
ncbi:hypothetical protein CI610_03579 [invertebrate metagenome]|uniref:Uncharacterized protein n=1 Tax=invertebrate metagenome TaxID=1711999 RepID=A0A2H9T2P3_9ZZZZ